MTTIEEARRRYDSTILSRLAAVESLRLKARRILLQAIAANIFILVIAGLIIGMTNGADFGVAISALVACGVVFSNWYKDSYKSYISTFKDAVIGEIVGVVNSRLRYVKDGYVQKQVFMESGLFTSPADLYYGDDYVSGMIDRTAVAFSELNVKCLHRGGQAAAGIGIIPKPIPVFRGLFFAADVPGDFSGLTVVVPAVTEKGSGRAGRQPPPDSGRGEPVLPDDPEFGKHFVVYADDPAAARRLLAPGLTQKIIEYRKKTRREIYLSFNASRLCVALPFDRALFEPKLFRSILDFSLAEPYIRDINLAVGIVEDLNLNSPPPADAAAGDEAPPAPEQPAARPGEDLLPARLPPLGPVPDNIGALRRGCGCTFLLLPWGLGLLFAAPVYFWTELDTGRAYRDLRGAAAVAIAPDSIDGKREGQLVYTTGMAATSGVLRDPLFDVSAPALRLRRKVEMFQWQEVRPSGSTGGTQSYPAIVYNKVWSEALLPSTSFKEPGHENPASKPLASETQIASRAMLGAFVLAPALVEKIGAFRPLPLSTPPPRWQGTGNEEWLASGSFLYKSAPSSDPPIGTIRVSFEIAKPTVISVVARQVGGTLDAYTLGRGGASKAVVKAGNHTPESLLELGRLETRVSEAWKSRGGLILAMIAAFSLVLRPLAYYSDRLSPALRILVGERTFLAAVLLASFVVSLAVGLGWALVLPWLGIPALLVSCSLLVGAVRFFRKQQRFEGGAPVPTKQP